MERGAAVPREASLIANTRSRKGRRMFREAKALLATAGVDLIHAIAVRNPADLNAEVGAMISSVAQLVIVGGGAGAVSRSVDSSVDKDCIFALLALVTPTSLASAPGLQLTIPGPV